MPDDFATRTSLRKCREQAQPRMELPVSPRFGAIDPFRRCYPEAAMAWRVGVDVGGTFTDLAAIDDAGGAVRLEKVPTTTADQSIGVAAGLTKLLGRGGLSLAAVSYLGHGTTVCINAVLERKGARTGLV